MSNNNINEPQAGPSSAPQYNMALVPANHQFPEPQPGPSNAMPNQLLAVETPLGAAHHPMDEEANDEPEVMVMAPFLPGVERVAGNMANVVDNSNINRVDAITVQAYVDNRPNRVLAMCLNMTVNRLAIATSNNIIEIYDPLTMVLILAIAHINFGLITHIKKLENFFYCLAGRYAYKINGENPLFNLLYRCSRPVAGIILERTAHGTVHHFVDVIGRINTQNEQNAVINAEGFVSSRFTRASNFGRVSNVERLTIDNEAIAENYNLYLFQYGSHCAIINFQSADNFHVWHEGQLTYNGFDIVRVVTYRYRLYFNVLDTNTIHAKFIRNITPILQNVFARARSGTIRNFVVINDRISCITSRGHIEIFSAQTMNKIYHIVLRAQHRAASLTMINDNIIFGSFHGEIYSSNLFAHKPTARDCCWWCWPFYAPYQALDQQAGGMVRRLCIHNLPNANMHALINPAEELPDVDPNDVQIIDE